MLRCTLLLRALRVTPRESVDLIASLTERTVSAKGSSPLELNLLEDPSAGLASGPAEELTPTELETRVRVLVSCYTPSLFRLLYTPFIDVVDLLVKENLVPEGKDMEQLTTTRATSAEAAASKSAERVPAVSTSARPVRPEEVMARWFTDGASTLKHPHETAEAMGKRRWAHLCRALEAHWADMEAVMPLTRIVRQHGLREELYTPLLRQLAMELADPTKRAAAVVTLPGLILSLANGRAPRSLGLPENDAERIQLVSGLFLGVAQEAGDTDLAYLALQLLRANNMEVPFAAQKQLTNVFAASSRISTDWQMRGSSLLVECFRKWLEYFKTVRQDNLAALAELDAAESEEGEKGRLHAPSSASSSRASASVDGETTEEQAEQYRYFTSRRQDDVSRIAAIENNIEEAVRERAAELRRTPTRSTRSVKAMQGRSNTSEPRTAPTPAAAATVQVTVKTSPKRAGREARITKDDEDEGKGDDVEDGDVKDVDGASAKRAARKTRGAVPPSPHPPRGKSKRKAEKGSNDDGDEDAGGEVTLSF